jgi:hypothetical protein
VCWRLIYLPAQYVITEGLGFSFLAAVKALENGKLMLQTEFWLSLCGLQHVLDIERSGL